MDDDTRLAPEVTQRMTRTRAADGSETIYGFVRSDFRPGERVLVNTDDRLPSPPGVFIVWDGFGLVIKRLEVIPYSDPATVRLISANADYAVYERPLEDVTVNGRVIGRWQWT